MVWLGERVEPALDEQKRKIVDEGIAKFNSDQTRLVDILLCIQNEMSMQYISKEVASYLSWKLDIPLSRTFDVISFYGALSDTPRGTFVVQYCDSVVCRLTGHTEIEARLVELLGVKPRETSKSGSVWLESVPCFGACDISPAIRINGVVYGRLTDVNKIEDALKRSGLLNSQIPGSLSNNRGEEQHV